MIYNLPVLRIRVNAKNIVKYLTKELTIWWQDRLRPETKERKRVTLFFF